MKRNISISPSILACDFARLGEEVTAIGEAGADSIHVDIMDGHFVPNISIGPAIVGAIRKYSILPFDVHLMISPVDQYIAAFAEAGANVLTVHPEAGPHLHRTIQLIKDYKIKAGVSLNPGTPIEAVDPILDDINLVLVMCVNPGFGGQEFLPSSLKKIAALRKLIDARGCEVDLAVDGGITPKTAPWVVEAGANQLIAGTSVFQGGSKKYSENIDALRTSVMS